MKLLSPHKTVGPFSYAQVLRKGDCAVYSQSRAGRLIAYEAFRIQSHNGYELAGTWIEPAESMPSASAWGIHGFTYSVNSHAKPLEAAMRRMAMMVAKL